MKTAVIVGCGSIGSRHLSAMLSRGLTTFVVEPRGPVDHLIEPSIEKGLVKWYPSIESLRRSEDLSNCGAIISNLAPDHLSSMRELSSAGVKSFLVEKPLSDSYAEIEAYATYLHDPDYSVRMNLPWRQGNLPKRLQDFASEKRLGSPRRVLASSGAAGFSEIGIHILDFAEVFFNGVPHQVFSKLQSDPINPRNKELNYFDGTALFSFEENRDLVLTMSNKVRVAGSVTFDWERGSATIDMANGELVGRWIEASNPVLELPANRLTSTTHEEVIATSCWGREGSEVYEAFLNREKSDHSGLSASLGLIGAVASSELDAPVSLPLDLDFQLRNRKWQFT